MRIGVKITGLAQNRRVAVVTSRKLQLVGSIIWALLFGTFAEAQQPGRVHRIGFLFAGDSAAVLDRLQAFREGLHERGYIENKNILIEPRYGDGKLDHMPALAVELVNLKVDVTSQEARRIHAPPSSRRQQFQ